MGSGSLQSFRGVVLTLAAVSTCTKFIKNLIPPDFKLMMEIEGMGQQDDLRDSEDNTRRGLLHFSFVLCLTTCFMYLSRTAPY